MQLCAPAAMPCDQLDTRTSTPSKICTIAPLAAGAAAEPATPQSPALPARVESRKAKVIG
jgi:hypothetical protein